MAFAGLLLSRRENAVAAAGRGDAYTATVAIAGVENMVSFAVEDATTWATT
ncbi:hypothetical protein ACP70R_014755 [Stipagrostis hirtigluma subsp. patula]